MFPAHPFSGGGGGGRGFRLVSRYYNACLYKAANVFEKNSTNVVPHVKNICFKNFSKVRNKRDTTLLR